MNNSFHFSWKFLDTKELRKCLLEAIDPLVKASDLLGLKSLKIAHIDGEKVVLQFSSEMFKNKVSGSSIETHIRDYLHQNLPLNPSFEIQYSIKDPDPVLPNRSVSDSPTLDIQVSSNKYKSLRSEFSFDAFVCGPSNRYAFESAVAAARNPGDLMHNPLFIYGDVGLGKTHLLHAIGNQIKKNHPEMRILFLTCEEMLNRFVEGLRTRDGSFREWRKVDVLLVDDVQFLSRKEAFQDEFYNTYNALSDENRQLVFAADRKPEQIENLNDRLISRFRSGLLADIKLPDLETRMGIIADQAHQFRVDIDNDALEYTARSISSNVRELKGVFLRLCSKASLTKKSLDLPFAMDQLESCVKIDKPPLDSPVIISEVASFYGLSKEELNEDSRRLEVAFPRQVAMFMFREFTNLTLQQIGGEFKKTHQAVMYACRKVETMLGSVSKADTSPNIGSKDLNKAKKIEQLQKILGSKYDHASTHR